MILVIKLEFVTELAMAREMESLLVKELVFELKIQRSLFANLLFDNILCCWQSIVLGKTIQQSIRP
jgi:hypothetical protein